MEHAETLWALGSGHTLVAVSSQPQCWCVFLDWSPSVLPYSSDAWQPSGWGHVSSPALPFCREMEAHRCPSALALLLLLALYWGNPCSAYMIPVLNLGAASHPESSAPGWLSGTGSLCSSRDTPPPPSLSLAEPRGLCLMGGGCHSHEKQLLWHLTTWYHFTAPRAQWGGWSLPCSCPDSQRWHTKPLQLQCCSAASLSGPCCHCHFATLLSYRMPCALGMLYFREKSPMAREGLLSSFMKGVETRHPGDGRRAGHSLEEWRCLY